MLEEGIILISLMERPRTERLQWTRVPGVLSSQEGRLMAALQGNAGVGLQARFNKVIS